MNRRIVENQYGRFRKGFYPRREAINHKGGVDRALLLEAGEAVVFAHEAKQVYSFGLLGKYSHFFFGVLPAVGRYRGETKAAFIAVEYVNVVLLFKGLYFQEALLLGGHLLSILLCLQTLSPAFVSDTKLFKKRLSVL